MSDIFQEVDEAVQQDKASRLWKRFAPLVYTAIVLLILGVAGYEFWNWQKGRQQSAEAEAFYTAKTALQSGDYVLAEALFDDIADSKSHFAKLSAHYLAEVRLKGQGDSAAAADALKRAADGSGPFAETARLKAAYLTADEMSIEELQAWLAPLIDDVSSPFSYLAQEVVGARAFSLGDFDTARSQFNAIALSLDAPQGIRGRAERSLIAIDAIKAKNGSLK